jgi:putative transposase
MPKKGNTPEQIINKLREAEIMLSQGTTVGVICKKIRGDGQLRSWLAGDISL